MFNSHVNVAKFHGITELLPWNCPTRSSMLRHPILWQKAVTMPAKVEAACCRLCSIPLEAWYLSDTRDSGTSLTRSCRASAV